MNAVSPCEASAQRVTAAKNKLHILRDEAKLRADNSSRSCCLSHEWAGMSREHKIVFLMLAGVDGEVDAIAGRDWKEYAPPEIAALQLSIRQMQRSMLHVTALTRR